ncbi:MAG: hypothetical protein ACI8RZ_003679 [Myxococcota bacterium]|jgi:hypothetical protein
MRLSPVMFLIGCQYLEEVRTDPAEVTWGGYIYAYLEGAAEPVFLSELTADTPVTEPLVELVDLTDTLLIEATQPLEGSPGYWRFEIAPAGEEVAIRIGGEGMTTTVWRGVVPGGTATWLTGAVYSYETAIYDDFFTSIDGFQGISFPSLVDSELAAMWGEPMVPEDWAGASITVTDGEGSTADVLALAYDDTGALIEAGTGAVDLFIAPSLAPGTITLRVEAAGRDAVEEQWPARAGDLISAVFFALPVE